MSNFSFIIEAGNTAKKLLSNGQMKNVSIVVINQGVPISIFSALAQGLDRDNSL